MPSNENTGGYMAGQRSHDSASCLIWYMWNMPAKKWTHRSPSASKVRLLFSDFLSSVWGRMLGCGLSAALAEPKALQQMTLLPPALGKCPGPTAPAACHNLQT